MSDIIRTSKVLGGYAGGFGIVPAATDAATTAWVNAVIANGGTVSAGRQTLVNSLILGLKSDGIWAKLDRLWIHAAENEPSALTDMVALDLAVNHSSTTFTIDRGYTGNGTTMYIDSTYRPGVDAVNFVRDSNHQSNWVRVLDTSGGVNQAIQGVSDGVYETTLFLDIGSALYRTVNSTVVQSLTAPTGHILGTRTGANAQAIYVNGNSSNTGAGASIAITGTNPVHLLSESQTGTPSLFGKHQISASSMGGGTTGTDATNFNSRLQTYMTAVGA